MSRKKTERQLNLVICLLSTRRHLTAQEIRATVHGYAEAESEQAFKRMFERDKRELRDSGIPIQVGTGDAVSGEEGYRISRADYELPEIELLPDEALVLGLAARAWRHAALGEAAANALFKLRSAGVPVDTDAAPGLTPAMRTDEPAFGPVWQAVRDRRPIAFDYRKPGQVRAERRELEPWGVVNQHGHWYVVGHDRHRGARRVFRLGRVRGAVEIVRGGPDVVVPEGVDLRSVVAGHRADPELTAVLRVRTDAAHALRRGARRVVPGERDGSGTGWDTLEYPYTDVPDLVEHVASFGSRAVVDEPAEAREAMVAHMSAVAEAEAPSGTPVPAEGGGEGGAPSRGPRSADQLRRLLMLVPYALGRDVRVPEVAAHFGLTEKQVVSDLSLLWMCGLPGYTPGDLIDVDLDAAKETGEIIIGNADTLAQPLRLTADEAASLVVGLSLLESLPEGLGSGALERVGEKLRSAAGSALGSLADSVQVRVEEDEQVAATRRRCTEALETGQRLHLRYLSGYLDQVTERDVDPLGLVVQDGRTFLEGYCHLREDVRLFRLDRVLELTVLPFAAEVPEGVGRRDLSGGLLQRSDRDALVTLDLEPSAHWVVEDYVCESVAEMPGGGLRATLRTPAPEWVVRLALRLGPRGRIAAPEVLAEEARAEARRTLEHYGELLKEGEPGRDHSVA
ncbi:helix-turn-helix transcriptional regulator [Nocardiopsis algeriensis]|uniref:Proteasome accessory factor B/proteasome accessory factor C n=1 Tax=Nocardiopsis algeriensis TaxID=1478215 RepID=A0A841IQP2_9ACTN|nr:WYL domain-containing protein [Nocardiopsis algeriensis]MBB6121169.1 proteasome accessory factor B/proteasome accessory factor C [Nocardiopsis algeriensis]